MKMFSVVVKNSCIYYKIIMGYMKKIYLIFTFFTSLIFYSQEFKWGMTGNIHSSSIEGVHDFSRGRIAPTLGLFAEIPMETFQRSIYAPLRYYIYPVVEFSMEGEKTILEQGRQYYRNDFVAMALYGKFHLYRGYFENFYFMIGPRAAYAVSVNFKGPSNEETGYIYLNDDVTKKWSFAASVALGYVISDKLEMYVRFDQGLTKVYPNYNAHRTWNRLLGLGFSYYFN